MSASHLHLVVCDKLWYVGVLSESTMTLDSTIMKAKQSRNSVRSRRFAKQVKVCANDQTCNASKGTDWIVPYRAAVSVQYCAYLGRAVQMMTGGAEIRWCGGAKHDADRDSVCASKSVHKGRQSGKAVLW